MRVVVCLPTYDERENLEPMARALGEIADEHRLDLAVLVIDDASPDGTGELADRLAAELPFLSVLHRPQKQGLGPAYIAGFQRALEGDADLIVEMDCDFSHNPAGTGERGGARSVASAPSMRACSSASASTT